MPTSAGQTSNTWSGTWVNSAPDGSFWVFSQSGASVDGVWKGSASSGTLSGTVSGDNLSGSFVNNEAGESANFSITLASDGHSFSGTFTVVGGSSGEWRSTCSGGACLSNAAPPTTPPPTTPTPTTPTEPTTPPAGNPKPKFGTDLVYSAPAEGDSKPVPSPVVPRSTTELTIAIALTGQTGTAIDSTPAVALSEPIDEKAAKALLKKLKAERAVQRAMEICYVFTDWEPEVAEELERLEKKKIEGFTLTEVLHGNVLLRVQERYEKCVKALARVLLREPPEAAPTARSTGAHAARAGCVRAIPLILRAKRGSRRARLTVGSPRQAHPRLKIRCTKTGEGAIGISIRPRKRSTKLRAVLGRRLKIGVGRTRSGAEAQEGDRLTVRWGKSAR